ncbi:glycosyltransferase family 2 protein [Staphylococcus canis]|uniref:Glycosyltransferase family 2 protein n=1 Tax=Staphylococcus canis TaxID=2724942 RepID=A0ABS0T797_9STAP|nr:glycosyltransferase family A protein [Staphylococcus canis]MBI5974450.1 glycosyltransferase family 2 protein [Staphylococcus canis]
MRLKKPMFSIIVTTYNNEQSIIKAIQSITTQTIDKDKYEIIVVDDNSTDNTVHTINQLAVSNLKLIQLEHNTGGPSIPRNTGMIHATGEFIYFLDGDDWLDATILERIHRNRKLRKSDVIIGEVIKTKNGNESVYARFMTAFELLNASPLKNPYLFYYLGPAGKFVKRSLIQRNKMKFMEHTRFGEDKLFFMKLFEHAKRVSTLPDIVTYLNRSTDNQSIVRTVDFVEKRESDLILFNEALQIKDKKIKDQFLIRITEYDLLTNCDSFVFINLDQKAQAQVFEIVKQIFNNKYVKKRIAKQINVKYKNAVEAIYEDDFEKFIHYYKWLKKGGKLLSFDQQLKYISDDAYHFELIVPYSNLMHLQPIKDELIIQAKLYNVKKGQINHVVLENRSDFRASVQVKAIDISEDILTVRLSKDTLRNLKDGLYNVLICYDGYKLMNIKYGFNKEVFGVTFYPTVNGNLSIKKKS